MIQPGQRVALCLPSGPALRDLLVECWRQRAVAVPIDPALPRAMREFLLAHADPATLVSEAGVEERATTFESHPDDRLILYTSGSTGAPKGVVLREQAIAHNALAIARRHGFGPDHVHVTCLPLHHCNAICMSLMGNVLTEGTLYLVPLDAPGGYLAAAGALGASTVSASPMVLRRILVEHEGPWPESIAYVMTAAAPLTRALATAWAERFGLNRLVQGYGMTEATNFSCVMPALPDRLWRAVYLDRDTPPVGLPLNGTELRIVAREAGASGEIEVRGPNLMACYWRDPEATAAAIRNDGWLRTGDLGTVDPNGWVTIVGRAKETIKKGDATFYPSAIEDVWQVPGAVAVGIRDRTTEVEEIGAWVPDARTFRSASYPPNYRPLAVRSEAPLVTATGKPRRQAMGALLACRSFPAQSYTDIFWHAHRVAARIATTDIGADGFGGSIGFIVRHARALAASATAPDRAAREAGVAGEALEALDASWSTLLAGGIDGAGIFRQRPGLWRRLMCEAPMGVYADLAAELLRVNGWLAGDVLELGAGVGNLSSRIGPLVSGRWVRTDAVPGIMPEDFGGERFALDFDQLSGGSFSGAQFDTIAAVNALHCASDPAAVLRSVFDLLRPGGVVVLGEGVPFTLNEIPWALSFLFGLMDGWWDRGGFRTRGYWLDALAVAGFRRIGWAGIRAGAHDLGGVVWAARP